MPLYEYECSACHHRFELLQKFSDEPARACIHCGGPVSRLISRSAIQFKGTGWYVTDYARKDVPASEAKDNGKSEQKEPAGASKQSADSKDVAAKEQPSPRGV